MLHLNNATLNMDDNGDLQGLPSVFHKHVIEEVAADHKFEDYELTISEGSTKGDNFFGKLFKVKVTGKIKEKENQTRHWVLKIAPDNDSFREVVPLHRYYCREVNAYTVVLPSLYEAQINLSSEEKFKFVKCHVACNEEYNELLVMDDLNIDGYTVYDRLIGLDHSHTMLAVKHLAQFHATSFVLTKKNPEEFKNLCEGVCQKLDYGIHFDKFINQNRKQILKLIDDTEIHSKLSVYLQDMDEKLKMLVDPRFAEPYNILCHGDCWTSNILFKYHNGTPIDMIMVDWQVLRLASPITDLAYLLFTSTDEKLRAVHFNEILKLYYETMKHNIKRMGYDIADCFPRSVFDDHIRVFLPFGLLMSIVICPIILCDRDQGADLAKSNENFNEDAEHETKFSKTPAERIKGVVNDFVKYQFI